jgi:hypothetical protein
MYFNAASMKMLITSYPILLKAAGVLKLNLTGLRDSKSVLKTLNPKIQSKYMMRQSLKSTQILFTVIILFSHMSK